MRKINNKWLLPIISSHCLKLTENYILVCPDVNRVRLSVVKKSDGPFGAAQVARGVDEVEGRTGVRVL